MQQPAPLPPRPRRAGHRARVGRSLTVALAGLALLAAACDEGAGGPAAPEQTEATMELEAMLEQEEASEEEPAAHDEERPAGEPIEPGTTLGPGPVSAPVGEVVVAFTLEEEVEGGTVSPGDLPTSLELPVEGGAIVLFEAIGHVASGEGEPDAVTGLPDDLEDWLTTDLPGDLAVEDGPTTTEDGVHVRLTNPDEEASHPVVLWHLDVDTEVEQQEGHGPPPGQSQDLWLRELDGRWIGVVTYGPEVDRDLAAAIAESLTVE